MLSGSGVEDDGLIPLYSVAPQAHGEIAQERFSSCPLALCNPDSDPDLRIVYDLRHSLTAFEGLLACNVGGWTNQAVDAVQVLDSELTAMHAARFEREKAKA